jgi:hypothetical protein
MGMVPLPRRPSQGTPPRSQKGAVNYGGAADVQRQRGPGGRDLPPDLLLRRRAHPAQPAQVQVDLADLEGWRCPRHRLRHALPLRNRPVQQEGPRRLRDPRGLRGGGLDRGRSRRGDGVLRPRMRRQGEAGVQAGSAAPGVHPGGRDLPPRTGRHRRRCPTPWPPRRGGRRAPLRRPPPPGECELPRRPAGGAGPRYRHPRLRVLRLAHGRAPDHRLQAGPRRPPGQRPLPGRPLRADAPPPAPDAAERGGPLPPPRAADGRDAVVAGPRAPARRLQPAGIDERLGEVRRGIRGRVEASRRAPGLPGLPLGPRRRMRPSPRPQARWRPPGALE